MLRLSIIFLAFVINTTITYYFTQTGTWENLLLQSMSLSMIVVFLVHYVRFVIADKKKKQINELREKIREEVQEEIQNKTRERDRKIL